MDKQTGLKLKEKIIFRTLIKGIDDGRFEVARPMKNGIISIKRVSLTLRRIIKIEDDLFISSRFVAESLRVHGVAFSQSISIKNAKMRVSVVNYDLVKEKLGVK